MDKAEVDRWLGSYVEAWKTYDPDLIGALFADDIKYRYHPYDDPLVGRHAVVGSWVGESDAPGASARDAPGTYDANYAAIAVDGDCAVATGVTTRQPRLRPESSPPVDQATRARHQYPDRFADRARGAGMIARTWSGTVRRADAETYANYIRETGFAEYGHTPGNRGAWMLRRDEGERTEFITLSLWESEDAIRAFAGDDIDAAVLYPEDERYLIDRKSTVTHYQVVDHAEPTGGTASQP